MSIIGPRPLLVEYLPYYTEEEHHRHDVRPGLSGWAQINGRNAIDSWEQRFAYDIEYVTKRNLVEWLKASSDDKRFEVIENGVPLEEFFNCETYSKVELFPELSKNDVLIAVVGSFTPQKNHKKLIEAMKLLPNSYKLKRVMQCAPEKVNGEDGLPIPPYRVYNIGNNSPENLLDFVDILQQELIRAGVLPEDYDFEAHKKLVPMQPGDVPVTYADTSALERDFGFKPSTSLREGLRRFAEWYKEFYL